MKRILGIYIIASTLLFSCSKREATLFRKVPSSTTHILFENKLKDTPDLNILTYLYYYNGGGVAAADFNNDGLIDLYFTSNQNEDKLYLNKGHLNFEDITAVAQIDNNGNWTTGVTHVDINSDGLLDIYICKVGNYQGISGKNLLYINQGSNDEGIPIFKEEAEAYGLAFSGLSTQATFFDYDLDGDLDMYLMNHSTHPNSSYGKGSQRLAPNSISGDRLYKNDAGKFIDVSLEAGIYQGKIGYGLGLSTGDLNNDGYPDIYVGNDFFENDYLYINQRDGTFKEIITKNDRALGHTTHFSMGNDIADINNDGLNDIVSMDMLPENLETYKTSGLEHPYSTYRYFIKNGYAPQYMQNTLHLNMGNSNFSEIAHLSGIAATEWSWAPLLADFNNDGHKDLFVSNGIKGATNDMDFINFIANDEIQKNLGKNMSKANMSFIKKIPEKKVSNYFFRNNGDLSFSDVTDLWSHKEPSFSNGAVYADLDNDGDLDIVVNNVDQKAYVLENTTNTQDEKKFLKISFKGTVGNLYGIGARVIAYTATTTLTYENFTTRGYLSAVPPEIHLGLGLQNHIDSLKIIWPNGAFQTLENLPVNQEITVSQQDAAGNFFEKTFSPNNFPYTHKGNPIPFKHKDQETLAFDRNPLIPFANTNEGPSISIADINNDTLDDIFIGGGKLQASALFIQDTTGSFHNTQEALFQEDAINEDISHIFFDANGNGFKDLLVVSGGNEFSSGKPLRPRLYLNKNGHFIKDANQFENVSINASKVASVDLDNDGDLDIAITSDQAPQQFGKTPKQYLFQNQGNGKFKDITSKMGKDLQDIGPLKDMVWIDLDKNGFQDLIAVGHWIPITIFMNDGKILMPQENNSLNATNGWWNTIVAEDFDLDGDIDLMAGNWGNNSTFVASDQEPINLYRNDFDSNGSVESLVTYHYKGKETPFASKDELAKQMPFLNKEFLSYKSFAKADLEDLFSAKKLRDSDKKEVYTLASSYFENDGNGNFIIKKLPRIAQSSIIKDIAVKDFDNDGLKDVLIVGNSYEVSTQLGRMDALNGIVLRNDGKGNFLWAQNYSPNIIGPARDIQPITIHGVEHYLISINNGAPIMITATNNKKR